MRVAFVGGAEVGRRFLEILGGLSVDIIGVLPGHLAERHTPLITPFARDRGLRVVERVDEIAAAEVIVSVGNHVIFPPAVCASVRIINFHAAPLPEYAGSAAHAWATLNAETSFGVTFHYIVPELDAGPILHVERFAVDPDGTAAELETACVERGAAGFARLGLAMLRGDLPARPGVKPAHIYKRADIERFREIDMTWPREKIWRHIRAFDWNGILRPAFVRMDGREVFLTARMRGTCI